MTDQVAVVAEVSSNHHQSLERCLEFVRASARIGCSAVKFQLFQVDQLFAPEILERSASHRDRRRWELPLGYLPEIASCCRDQGLLFSCTPFYLDAVIELEPYVDFYKIASYELLWSDLLIACARTGKPVVLSTGMATWDEVETAVTLLRTNGCRDLTLLHCVSSYPTPAKDCNLALIERLRSSFECQVGWSDHSRDAAVLYRAVHRWQASMIEFHLDLDGQGEEFRAGHCWLPEAMSEVIKTLKTGASADGSGDTFVAESERGDRDWRADPVDGLRPLERIRSDWRG